MQTVTDAIDAGTLRPGDRLPSLRKMSQRAGVSVPTVRQAYIELERLRRVESRPRSGFFVRQRDELPLVRPRPRGIGSPSAYRARPLVQRVFDGIDQPELVPLGIANPTMARPATKSLHRTMKRLMARTSERSINYSATLGEPILRRQIALHLLDTTGVQVDPEEICITNGAQEALLLALKAVARPGDVIAVESPTYHGMLELIDSLDMLALEVETCPEEGLVIGSLESALKGHRVAACMVSTTLSNPLGVSMPEVDRQRLIDLLGRHDVALIEDDVYGELRFDGVRPTPCHLLERRPRRARSQHSNTLRGVLCGSFSKTIAPGFRIGWAITSQHRDEIARLKRSYSCTSGMLSQLTLADTIASGDYLRHLTALRTVLQQNCERSRALVARHFPSGTRVSRPHGGSVLWIHLPGRLRSEQLFEEAIDGGISIAPGAIFSPSNRFPHHIRLSFGHPWSTEIEGAIEWLGRRVAAQARQ